MIFIDIQKTKNSTLNSIINELYGDIESNNFIEIKELGTIINNSLRIYDSIRNLIHSVNGGYIEIPKPYLTLRIINSMSNESYDLKNEYLYDSLKEIYIADSKLDVLKIYQNFNNTLGDTTKLNIENTKIRVFSLNLNKHASFEHQHINFIFKKLTCELTLIDNQNGVTDQIQLQNLETNIIYLNLNSIKLKNSSFQIPIFHNLFNLKLDLSNSTLYFKDNFPRFKSFENYLNEIYGDKLKIYQSEIASSLKYLKGINQSSIFSLNIERLYSYIDSRGSFIKRLLYWYTSYYYNLFIPSIGLLLSLLTFQLIIQYNSEFSRELQLGDSLLPYDFLKNVILKDFRATWKICDISLIKLFLIGNASLIYFSIFALSLGIKRRFGYNKI